MICKCCGHILDEQSRFCMRCGTEVARTQENVCRICGMKVPSDMSFCGYCGNVMNSSYGSGKNEQAFTSQTQAQAPNYTISTPPKENGAFERWIKISIIVMVILFWILVIIFMLAVGAAKKKLALEKATKRKEQTSGQMEDADPGEESEDADDDKEDDEAAKEQDEDTDIKSIGKAFAERLESWAGKDS